MVNGEAHRAASKVACEPAVDGWRRYLESLSLARCDLLVTVGPGGDPAGDQPDRARPLHGIRYDAHTDEIEVAVGFGASPTLRYFLASPRSIAVDDLEGTKILRVVDADGVETVIGLAGITYPQPTFDAQTGA